MPEFAGGSFEIPERLRKGRQVLNMKLSSKVEGLMQRYPWTDSNITLPYEYWDDVENVKRAVNWLIKTTKKTPKKLFSKANYYFPINNLYSLLNSRGGDAYLVFKEAGKANFFVWEVRTPRAEFWDELENRISGVKELDKELKKEKRTMTVKEFERRNLSTLIYSKYYKGDVSKARKEAGLSC